MNRAQSWFAAFLMILILAVIVTYRTVPAQNTVLTHFDVLIVLGSPADPDGKASPEERERVLEGVREFKAGRAGHIIVTGGAVHNEWNEGRTMAPLALAAGVPTEDLIVEPYARNTIENIFYCHKIMERQGWSSAEVVSSPSHLPRAGLILEHYNFRWRTHAAKWPVEYNWRRKAPYYLKEAVGTTILRWFGYKETAFMPWRG